jgi:hypothetical protein
LVRRNSRLWMDTRMQGIEVVNPIAQTFTHGSQEMFQGLCLIATINLVIWQLSTVKRTGLLKKGEMPM